MKIKTSLLSMLMLVLILSFSSCISDSELRPAPDSNFVWVSEYPFSYFQFNEVTYDTLGKLIYNGVEYPYYELENPGPTMEFVQLSAITEEATTETEENSWFFGEVDYNEGYFIFTIKEDYQNIFNGEIETMTFVRYSLDEFTEKFGELDLDFAEEATSESLTDTQN